MINFILPNFFDNYIINQEIISDRFLDNNIYGVEGGFSFSIFRGKINNNKYGKFVCYSDMKGIVEDYKEIGQNLILIDCGNLYLNKTDYMDTFNKVMFELYVNEMYDSIYFEVADEGLIDYLVNKYPQIQLCLHENYTMFHSENKIQKLLNKYPNIKFINITIMNLCKNVNCQKIGVLNLDSCYYCPHFPICLKVEQKGLLRYKEFSQFNECEKKKFVAMDSLTLCLKELLQQTNNILFSSAALIQKDFYVKLIYQILEEEKKGTFK